MIHGGAGYWGERKSNGDDQIEKIADKIEENIESRSALEIVEQAVRLLESNKAFNAGRGAKFQIDGEIRLDASIMTSDLEAGSVIGLKGGFEHPISIAQKIMEDTHHIALKGSEASEFASEFDFETSDLETEHRREELTNARKEIEGLDFKDTVARLKEMDQKGTVGAVAVDSEGRMAAATSTGGVHGQLAGRVGDTPMPGCGTYCNEEAAVSATGVGEAIIKTTLTRRTCSYIEQGKQPQKAVEKALEFLEEKTGREAGLITVDKKGEIGIGFNSDEMVWTKR